MDYLNSAVMSGAKNIRLDDLKEWIRLYEGSNPSDMLKVKNLLDQTLGMCNVLVIGARLEPGDIHQPHYHKSEAVIVYGLRGSAVATVDGKEIKVTPDTLVFIPPMAVHQFVNNSKLVWECVAMAIGPKDTKLENIWINRP